MKVEERVTTNPVLKLLFEKNIREKEIVAFQVLNNTPSNLLTPF